MMFHQAILCRAASGGEVEALGYVLASATALLRSGLVGEEIVRKRPTSGRVRGGQGVRCQAPEQGGIPALQSVPSKM